VVLAIEAGEACRWVAARFGVSVSAVVKWSQRYRATGSVAPSKMGGHRKRILESHRAFIIERINQTSHLTVHGLKAQLVARGVKVSHDTLLKFLRREGLSCKSAYGVDADRHDKALKYLKRVRSLYRAE
jgi:transposase